MGNGTLVGTLPEQVKTAGGLHFSSNRLLVWPRVSKPLLDPAIAAVDDGNNLAAAAFGRHAPPALLQLPLVHQVEQIALAEGGPVQTVLLVQNHFVGQGL